MLENGNGGKEASNGMPKDYFLGDYDEVKHILHTVVQAGASVRLCVQG